MKQKGVIYHNGYYRFSKLLKPVRYAVLLLLVIFTVVIFTAFSKDMTLNHFRYLLNNFDFSPNAGDTSGDTMYYDGDADATFGFVSGGLVTLTDTRVFVTDRSSSTTLSLYHGYRQPTGAFSDKYMLLYDRKGSVAGVYNAFSLLKTFTYDGTVLSAACADNGYFATVVADVDRYYTKVYVYDENFNLVREVSKYKYVTEIAFTPNGKELLIGSRYTENGKTAYEVMLLDIQEGKATFTLSLEGASMRLFARDDGFWLMDATSLSLYDYEGERITKTAFSKTPHKSVLLESGAALVTSDADSRNETLTYLAKTGEYTAKLPSRYVTAEEDRDYLYLVCERDICLLDKKSGAFYTVTESLTTDSVLTLVKNKDAVYLARTYRADRLYGARLVENIGKNAALT